MILCCGEALIDMLPRESTAGETAFAPYVGGAVYNTAIALGRLGAPVGFFSGLSSDFFGGLLKSGLIKSNVDVSHAVISERPTTLAFVQLLDGQASYTFYDENTAGRLLSVSDIPNLANDVKTLFFGGISLISEPGASAYEAMMARYAENRITMLDPNIRAGFIADATSYRARIDRMLALADIVKLSDEDLHWLEGPQPIDQAVDILLSRGAKLVVITRGEAGAIGCTASHRVEVPSRPVAVADTVGAGDTFNAGILAALQQHDVMTKAEMGQLDEAVIRAVLDLGTAAAAVTVSRAGANPPWRHELT